MRAYSNRIAALVEQFTAEVTRLAYRAVADELGGARKRLAHGEERRFVGPSRKGTRRSAADLSRRSGEFLGFVTQNPGLRVEEINAALGTSTADLRLPIKKLLQEKSLRAEGRLRATRYFPR